VDTLHAFARKQRPDWSLDGRSHRRATRRRLYPAWETSTAGPSVAHVLTANILSKRKPGTTGTGSE
jgi:hypothetical protein